MKIRAVGAELFHEEGQTDKHTCRQAGKRESGKEGRRAGGQAGWRASRS
jgi:hypothetical protein